MQTLENIAPNPEISFGVIREAVKQFKGNAGTWIFAALIYLLIVLGDIYTTNKITGFAKPSPRMPAVMRFLIPVETSMMSKHPLLIPTSLVVFIIFFFLSAGLYRMATKQIRGHRFSIRDLFRISSVEASSIFAYAVVIWIFGTCTKLALFHLWYQSALHPESPIFRTSLYLGLVLHIFISIIWGGLFLFTLPLIVDQQINLIDALSKSFTALKHQWLMAILFFIVVEIISIIGWYFCLVGTLITFPIEILSVTILYRNFFIGPSSPPLPGKKLFEPAIPPGN